MVAGEVDGADGVTGAGVGFAEAGGIAESAGVSRCVGVGGGIAGIVADEVAIGVRLAAGSAVSGGKDADVTARGTAPVGMARGGVVISSASGAGGAEGDLVTHEDP